MTALANLDFLTFKRKPRDQQQLCPPSPHPLLDNACPNYKLPCARPQSHWPSHLLICRTQRRCLETVPNRTATIRLCVPHRMQDNLFRVQLPRHDAIYIFCFASTLNRLHHATKILIAQRDRFHLAPLSTERIREIANLKDKAIVTWAQAMCWRVFQSPINAKARMVISEAVSKLPIKVGTADENDTSLLGKCLQAKVDSTLNFDG